MHFDIWIRFGDVIMNKLSIECHRLTYDMTTIFPMPLQNILELCDRGKEL